MANVVEQVAEQQQQQRREKLRRYIAILRAEDASTAEAAELRTLMGELGFSVADLQKHHALVHQADDLLLKISRGIGLNRSWEGVLKQANDFAEMMQRSIADMKAIHELLSRRVNVLKAHEDMAADARNRLSALKSANQDLLADLPE